MSLPTLAPLGPMIPLGIYTYLMGHQQVISGMQQIMQATYQLRSIVTQASITTYVFAMLMRRTSQTARSLETAQENANEAIRRYGRYSLEATQALRRLEQAEENARFAQVEFAMQTVYATLSIITMIPQIIKLIGTLGSLKTAYFAATIARAAFGDPVAVAGLIATGVGLAAITIQNLNVGGGSDEDWRNVGSAIGVRARREQARMRGMNRGY